LSFKVIKITNNINEGYGLNDRTIELASEFAIMLHIKGLNMLQIQKKKVELDVGWEFQVHHSNKQHLVM
jgi:hypothetical protein